MTATQQTKLPPDAPTADQPPEHDPAVVGRDRPARQQRHGAVTSTEFAEGRRDPGAELDDDEEGADVPLNPPIRGLRRTTEHKPPESKPPQLYFYEFVIDCRGYTYGPYRVEGCTDESDVKTKVWMDPKLARLHKVWNDCRFRWLRTDRPKVAPPKILATEMDGYGS